MEINHRRCKRFNNILRKWLKSYLFLVFLGLLAFSRIYSNCLVDGALAKCTEPSKSVFSDEARFPGGYIAKFRNTSAWLIRKILPSPHSELLMGTVMGADELSKVPKFKEELKISGTIHVVVVSGFNISLIFGFMTSLLGSKTRVRNLMIAQITTLLYAIMTGFQPPVIRAFIMGSVVSWVKCYRNSIETIKVLLLTALIMLSLWPYFLFSPSFQLSFLATLGIVAFGNTLSGFVKRFSRSESFLVEDFSTTLSAQVFVLPFVSYYFGRVSVVSFLVNPLVLWTIPIITVMGMLLLFLGSICSLFAFLGSLFIYPFLDIFVRVVGFSSSFDFSSVNFSASIELLVIYYLFALLALYFLRGKKGKIYENK